MPLAIHVLDPSVFIRVSVEMEGSRLFELVSEAALQFFTEVVRATPVLVDCVLQTRLLPVLPIARVALNQQHLSTNLAYLIHGHIADNAGKPRVRRLHRVCDTHTTTHG